MVFKFGAVASLDEVPDEFKPFYGTAAGTDGKFTVDPKFQAATTAYVGQATALEQERGKVTNLNKENQTRRTSLKAFEDLSSELGLTVENDDIAGAFKAHVTDLTGKVKGGEAFKGDLAKIQAAAEKKIAEMKAEHDKEIGAMRGTLSEYLIDKEAITALTANKAKNGGKVLLPHVQSKLRVVKTDDGKYVVRAIGEDGNVRYNAAAAPMTVEDVVKEVKQSPDYAFAFDSEAGAGTGAAPGGSKAPVLKTVGPQAGEKTSTQKISEGLTALQKTA